MVECYTKNDALKGIMKLETKEPKWRKILQLTSNAVMVNFLYLLGCIPIITIGQSWCALFSAIRFAIRGDGWFAGFKEGFKTRFLRGTVAWVVTLALVVYMTLNMLAMVGETIPMIVIHGLFLLAVLMISTALIVINVYIPSSVAQWMRNAVNMCFAAPLHVAASSVIMWLPTVLVVLFLRFGFLDPFFFIMVFLLIYYTLSALLTTILLKDALIRIKDDTEALEGEAA